MEQLLGIAKKHADRAEVTSIQTVTDEVSFQDGRLKVIESELGI